MGFVNLSLERWKDGTVEKFHEWQRELIDGPGSGVGQPVNLFTLPKMVFVFLCVQFRGASSFYPSKWC